MLKTLGVVQIGDANPFSANSVTADVLANRKLGGKPLTEWVVRCVTDAQQLEAVLVVMPNRPEHRQIAKLVPADVPVFHSDRTDPLGCLCEAIQAYPAEAIVRIGVNYPFIDPALIDRLVLAAEEEPSCDYVGYRAPEGESSPVSRLGMLAQWFRASTLLEVEQQLLKETTRQEIARYLLETPDRYCSRLLSLPSQLDRVDVRMALHVQEDWEHTEVILEALGQDQLDWQRIAGLLHHQPAIRERMAILNREDVNV